MIERLAAHPVHLRRLLHIKSGIYHTVSHLSVRYLPSSEPIALDALDDKAFMPFKTGRTWTTQRFGCCWFRFTGEIPLSASGRKVVAIVKLSGEGEVYQDGVAMQGLTHVLSTMDAGASLMGKQVYPLFDRAEGGEAVDFLVDAGNNGYGGVFLFHPVLLRADVATVDQDVYDYYYDYNCLLLTLCTKKDNEYLTDALYTRFEQALDASYRAFKKGSVQAARRILRPLFDAASTAAVTYTAIGHGHLDLAWRWPVRESRRKAVRTFTNALSSFDRYPHYVFGASQAQMFDWVKEDDPVLFRKIKQAVADGRIEVQGAMWTECDCNMSSGESIIRQFLYGEKFFRTEFGVSSDVAWLPDVFGFPATIPQIVRGVGKDYFMTIKLKWNTFNKFPYQSFHWVAPDGSSVLAHFPPEGTYSCSVSPIAFVNAHKRNLHKDAPAALVVYGVSDGGGGPGEGHLEMLERVGFEGLPAVEIGKSETMFDTLAHAQLPSYQGELYLERHQGTLTSQSLNKYYNRVCERKMHFLEWLEVASGVKCAAKEGMWKTIMLNQFHDILPGSGIARVHRESVEAYRRTEQALDAEIAARVEALADGERLTAVNPSPFPACDSVEVDGKCYGYHCPPYASRPLFAAASECKAGEGTISNETVELRLKKDGGLSVKHIRSGRFIENAHRLVLYDDPKTMFDAWDIDYSYLKKNPRKLIPRSVETGVTPSTAYILAQYRFGKSQAKLKIYITDSDLIRFELQVDWHASHKMLRAECHPDVLAPSADFDIQFGDVERSTADDTAIEKAQHEVCGQKYACMGNEKGYTAFITEGKYGYRIKGDLMSLNLLRSPKYPDKQCDMGAHTIRYALSLSPTLDEVVARAYCFNFPVLITHSKVDIATPYTSDKVIVETVKPAEEGEGVIVRAYERAGRAVELTDEWARSAETCDMLERRLDGSPTSFKPHEIKTLRIK